MLNAIPMLTPKQNGCRIYTKGDKTFKCFTKKIKHKENVMQEMKDKRAVSYIENN